MKHPPSGIRALPLPPLLNPPRDSHHPTNQTSTATATNKAHSHRETTCTVLVTDRQVLTQYFVTMNTSMGIMFATGGYEYMYRVTGTVLFRLFLTVGIWEWGGWMVHNS